MAIAATLVKPGLAVHRSRKMIPAFRLRRPGSPAEAVAMLAESGDGAVFMAGGIDLVNRMKFGEPVAEVIYLGGITELGTIAETEGGLSLGSLVTHYQLETSARVRAHFPELTQTWQDVANIRVRCKGTIGGNIMAADPGYDFALAAMGAGAQLNFLGEDGANRTVPAMELSGSIPHGLLTAITFPSLARLRFAFDRSLRPAVTLAVGLDLEVGRVAAGRVAIGCAFAAPMAATLPLDEPLLPREVAESAAILACDLAASLPEPLSDSHGGASYRRRMIEILLRRNLGTLADRLA
jgi:aerobic carbon-monoxide dehydrogenase medium subunit